LRGVDEESLRHLLDRISTPRTFRIPSFSSSSFLFFLILGLSAIP
jgi:hypothetical protein